MGQLVSASATRFKNGWRISPDLIGGSAYLKIFSPISGCLPLIAEQPINRQEVFSEFERIIKSLPKKCVASGSIRFPKLNVWQDYENGWACRVQQSSSLRDINIPRYQLRIKTPPTKTIFIGPWQFFYGRVTLRFTELLTQSEVENVVEYFHNA